MQEQNFADEIYKLFKSKRRTALRCNDLIEAYKKQYGRQLNTTELRELPFIQFERNGGNNNMIYLVVELDDCCNKCKFRYCKLLHSVDHTDKFILIYQNTNTSNNNKLTRIERPNIRLIQRVKDILNESNSSPKQVTLKDMKRRHNQKFPQFKSHEPTSHGIAIRFKSTFHIGYDEQTGDHLITFKHDQNHQNLNNSYKSKNRNNGYHSININNSYNKKNSNVIINSKKSHQSPWQKKTKPKVISSTHTHTHNNDNIPLNTNRIALKVSNKPPIISNESPPSTTNESQLSSSSNTQIEIELDNPTPTIETNDKEEIIENDKEEIVLPEQPNKHYLSIIISPEWNDSKLIPDLVRHISQHTGKHIGDAYINSRIRLGFFTAKNQSIAQQFVRNTRDQKVKCWGRTVSADIIPLPKNNPSMIGHGGHPMGIQRQQNGYRVKIQNVNCIMGRRDFEQWVYKITNTSRRRHLIYDIEIVFPKIQRGSNECIMLFDKADDTKYVMDKIQNVQFRGLPLVFKHWNHPNYIKPSPMPVTNKKHTNMKTNNQKLKIKSKGSNQKGKGGNIWAKMAIQRNQKKKAQLQQQQQQQQKQKEKQIVNNNSNNSNVIITDTASNISTKSSKSNKSSNELNNNMKQPLQPTKPPKKLMNAPINNVLNDNNNNSESIVTPEKELAPEKKEVINANMKKPQPRVPPLINRFRGGNNEQISNEIIIEKEETVGNNIEENNSTQQKEGIKETPMDENNECKEGEIDNSTDNVSCKSNTNESKQTPPTQPQQPPVVTTNTQPQTQQQQQQQQQQQPQTQANNNNTATSNPLNINQLNASLLAAQRQFNQLSNNNIQMNPVYLQQIQQLQSSQQPIRIVPITQLQQIQQLQQLQAATQFQQLNNINMAHQLHSVGHATQLPNIYTPQYNINNINNINQIPNINIPQYINNISQIPPPPPHQFNTNLTHFTPTPTNTQTPNTINTNPTQQQNNNKRINKINHNRNTSYQSPPRHQQQQQQQQNNNMNNNNINNINNINNNNNKSETNPSKQTNPWDRLCKFCLLAQHEPNKCFWFKPNYENQ